MKTRIFQSRIEFEEPRAEVFDFFSKPENLNLITPPWLHFGILTPLPIEMHNGARIDYRLKLYGLPVRWETEIRGWDPPFRFTDIQLRGPYRKWIHTHIFEDSEFGTLMTDHVEYAVPGWILEPVVHRLFVKRRIEKIFEYRREKLSEVFTIRAGFPNAGER